MIKIDRIEDDKLYFTDGSYIEYDHNQDCCEYNYVDWDSIEDTALMDMEFEKIVLDEWEYGFRINTHPVNCYSSQNGYYSTDVDITYYDEDGNIIDEIHTFGELEGY